LYYSFAKISHFAAFLIYQHRKNSEYVAFLV